MVSIFGLTGCYDSPEVSRQKQWNEDLTRAETIENQFRYSGAPLLLTEQLITLIGEPDYKMLPAEFEKILPEDAPLIGGLSYREWHMIDLWSSYRGDKKQRQIYSKIIYVGKWRDASEFNKCMLWIYDESQHFSKPLHSNDWAYCWFCAKPMFTVSIFFVEEIQVVGHHSMIYINAPLFEREK